MKNLTRHTGTLTLTACLPRSRNGMPRYLLTVDGVSCRTAPDSNLGLKVRSLDGKRVEATIGSHYGMATLSSVKAAPDVPSVAGPFTVVHIVDDSVVVSHVTAASADAALADAVSRDLADPVIFAGHISALASE